MWNSLSVNTRSADSFASFKRRLNLNCLHLLTPFRMVQRHRSAPIRVLCDPVRYINLLVVVVVVVVGWAQVIIKDNMQDGICKCNCFSDCDVIICCVDERAACSDAGWCCGVR